MGKANFILIFRININTKNQRGHNGYNGHKNINYSLSTLFNMQAE